MACSSNKTTPYDDFIKKHQNDQFNELKGFGIYQRGQDEKGNKLVYISKTFNTDSIMNSGNILLAITSNNEVAYFDSSWDRMGLNIDSVQKAALFFCSLNIFSLSVDYDGKVYFSIYTFDEPDLMKIPTDKNFEDVDRKKWTKIKTHWYIRNGS